MVDVEHPRVRQRPEPRAQRVVALQKVLVLHVAGNDDEQRRAFEALLAVQPPQLQLRGAAVGAVERMAEHRDVRLAQRETQFGTDLEVAGDEPCTSSEARRVGKECVSTYRYGGSPYQHKQKQY